MNKIQLAYIAGPYRGPTREATLRNIESAWQMGRFVAAMGYYPVVPHGCTPLFDWDYPNLQYDAFWLEAARELMRRCDVVVLCQGWDVSTGASGEFTEALERGIPVYQSLKDLPFAEKR